MFNSHIPVRQGSNPITPTLIKLHQKTSINHPHQQLMINTLLTNNISHKLRRLTKLDNLTAKHNTTTPNTPNQPNHQKRYQLTYSVQPFQPFYKKNNLICINNVYIIATFYWKRLDSLDECYSNKSNPCFSFNMKDSKTTLSGLL